MKQILQNFSTGQSVLVEVPAPQARPGSLFVFKGKYRAVLISYKRP